MLLDNCVMDHLIDSIGQGHQSLNISINHPFITSVALRWMRSTPKTNCPVIASDIKIETSFTTLLLIQRICMLQLRNVSNVATMLGW